MIRTHSTDIALLAVLLAGALGLSAPREASAATQEAPKRYFVKPCEDEDRDGIDDFFNGETDGGPVDFMLLFQPSSYTPATVRAAVQSVLGGDGFLSYVSEYSPYVFVDGITLNTPPSATPVITRLMNLNGVIGIRPYERFLIATRARTFHGEARSEYFAENMGPGSSAESGGKGENPPSYEPPPGGVAGPGGLAPRDATSDPPTSEPAYQQPYIPDVLLYFVDSGNDKETWWSVDATVDDPLSPGLATDPMDKTVMKHGSFLAALAGETIEASQVLNGGGPVGLADVKVAVGPEGETTTLELTRGLDAIMAHLIAEAAAGHHFRPVINISYDTDGGIANHDIIYPGPGGRIGPPDDRTRPNDGPPQPPPSGNDNPCDVPLFDTVYQRLATQFGAVICVGAGNDGLVASFVINEMAQSPSATIVVSALDDKKAAPAPYSNYGMAPNGINGHPDLAAPGISGTAGFSYWLEGTSVAAAFTSAMAASTLAKNPNLTPAMVRQSLVAAGRPLPSYGNKYYGHAALALPWSTQRVFESPVTDVNASPNPVTATTHVRFATRTAGRVKVVLFDLAGRLVASVFDGYLPAGGHAIATGSAFGAMGRPVAGLYFARIETPDGVGAARLLVAGGE